MNGSHVNTISNRLSLRPPQRESLEILARICDIIPLEKHTDLVQEYEGRSCRTCLAFLVCRHQVTK
jgi:hypothetical protein